MNQEKIGKFISKCRKNKNLTQSELAETLGITDRAVSKWERGLNLPDASLMFELCKILDINVNELLSGEIIKKDNYMKQAEENLIELKEIVEKSNKRFLALEVVLIIISVIAFVIIISVIAFVIMIYVSTIVSGMFLKSILITSACIIIAVAIIFAFIIEKETGYYECSKCQHKYIPTYKQVLFSTHMGWTRKLRCPKCDEKSWNKKVLTK